MQWLTRIFRRSRPPLGQYGEELAMQFLKQRGYRILKRNHIVGDDEADIIALDPDRRTIVIVEVKTRTSDITAPEAAMTATKQQRLIRLASRLQRSKEHQQSPFRFDVIAIICPPDSTPQIRHTPGAFTA